MITYKMVWEKGNKKGSFTVTGLTDDECIKVGHEEAESFDGEVTDYYQV